MKILHINTNYITSALHQTMMDHFDDSIDNVIFAPTYDKNRSVIEPNDNVIVSECFKKWDRLFFSYKQFKIIKAVEESVDVSKQDCIHAYTLFTDGNVAYNLSKKYKKPYVVAVRNTDVNDFFKHMIHLRSRGVRILRNASAVFFLSPAYQKTVIDKYVPDRLKEDILIKSHIIPNGIDDFWLENVFQRDSDKVEEHINSAKDLKCIYVGVIDANKNIEFTLKALRLLSADGWKATLTVIGKINDRRVFERLKRYKEFVYIQPKKKEDLIDFYRKADIFVMPSHTETFGLVYAEAMSQGLPVIYTRGQGFDKQFKDGVIGYSVSDRDIGEMIDKLKMCISNYTSLSKATVESVGKYNWEEICKEYCELYSLK